MFLIDENYLQERFSVSPNLPDADMVEALANVRDFHVQRLLGENLYQTLLGENLSAEQAALLDLIKPYYGLLVQYELAFKLFDITPRGPQTEPNSASLEMVQLKRNDYYHKAGLQKERVLAYLDTHKAAFPEYFPASTKVYQSPIVLTETPKKWYGAR